MSTTSERQVPVTVSLPYFVTLALNLLPRFVEAVGGQMGFATYKTLQYLPVETELAHDPEKGEVVFNFGGGYSVIFFFAYRPGEEGTRGSLSTIEGISLKNSDGASVFFKYVEHHCHCRTCPGLKYPFCPVEAGVSISSFEEVSEDERLKLIRDYTKKAERW